MDTITLVMFAFAFVIALIFTILSISGFFGVSTNKKRYEPIDNIWCWAAAFTWFAFTYLNVAFATDDMFVGLTYLYLGIGLLFILLGFYGLFLILHVSSEMRDKEEMRLQ